MKGFLLGTSFSVVFAAGLLIGMSGNSGLRDAKASTQWEYQCDWASSGNTLTPAQWFTSPHRSGHPVAACTRTSHCMVRTSRGE